MFKDVTIGQYYPVDSVIHRLDPRTKIIYTFGYIIILFFANNIVGYAVAAAFLAAVIALSKIPLRAVLRSLRTIMIIVAITVILNVFVTPGNTLLVIGPWTASVLSLIVAVAFFVAAVYLIGLIKKKKPFKSGRWVFFMFVLACAVLFCLPGKKLFTFGPLNLTDAGLINALFMALRLLMLIIGASIMTLTTTPIALTDGMEYCMRRVPGLRGYAHELSMMMTIALRFIPTLMEEADKIMKAQKARGADFETGGIFEKARNVVPILVPLFISSFKRADELAMAMDARCYRGGNNRTRLKELHYSPADKKAYLLTLAMAVLIIASRFLPLLKIPIR